MNKLERYLKSQKVMPAREQAVATTYLLRKCFEAAVSGVRFSRTIESGHGEVSLAVPGIGSIRVEISDTGSYMLHHNRKKVMHESNNLSPADLTKVIVNQLEEMSSSVKKLQLPKAAEKALKLAFE